LVMAIVKQKFIFLPLWSYDTWWWVAANFHFSTL
jgi:hypothetical protein